MFTYVINIVVIKVDLWFFSHEPDMYVCACIFCQDLKGHYWRNKIVNVKKETPQSDRKRQYTRDIVWLTRFILSSVIVISTTAFMLCDNYMMTIDSSLLGQNMSSYPCILHDGGERISLWIEKAFLYSP